MNENIILYRVIAYAAALWLIKAVVLHTGDAIAYLIKKLEEGGPPLPKTHTKSIRKKRRQASGVA